MPISAAFSTCAGVPPITSASAPAAIEQATPTSPWQPTSAPLIEAFSLYSDADGAGGEQEAHDAVVVGAGDEAGVVVQHGRDDAGGAVGGRGDDAPAGGVLLVDRQREQVDPVHDGERIARRRSDRRSARGGVSAARRRTLESRRAGCPWLRQPRLTQACIARPDPQQAGADLGLGRDGLLVREHHVADRSGRARAQSSSSSSPESKG